MSASRVTRRRAVSAALAVVALWFGIAGFMALVIHLFAAVLGERWDEAIFWVLVLICAGDWLRPTRRTRREDR